MVKIGFFPNHTMNSQGMLGGAFYMIIRDGFPFFMHTSFGNR